MNIALTYGPLSDIDLFAWSPPDGGDAYEVALPFKHALKIIPLTKQRLFEDELGLFLLGLAGPPLKISWAHQNLKTKTLYAGNYFFAFESSVLWISRSVQYFYRLFE
jgi:hypothetical protein